MPNFPKTAEQVKDIQRDSARRITGWREGGYTFTVDRSNGLPVRVIGVGDDGRLVTLLHYQDGLFVGMKGDEFSSPVLSSLVSEACGRFVLGDFNDLTGGKRFLGFPDMNAAPYQALSAGFLGDSFTKQCFDVPASGYGGASATDSAYSNYGWLAWMLYFSRANIKATRYAVAGAGTAEGYSGSQTSRLIEDQLPAALEANHDIYFLCPFGINDVNFTGTVSAANIRNAVKQIVNAGKRIILASPTPTVSYSTSKSRIARIIAEMRQCAVDYPTFCRFVDFHPIMSNASDVTDGAAYNTVFDATTYDASTHPNIFAASHMGQLVSEAIKDWLAPYKFPVCAGDQGIYNYATNPRLGGSTGTISSAGANSAAPTSWTASRGGASVTYSMYKARNTPLLWKTGITYPVGARIAPATPTGYHYIVLTSAAAGATAPSATTLWGQSTPDAGGPVYLTVPANDLRSTPIPGEKTIIDMATTGVSASDYVQLTQDIDATALVGKTLKAGLIQEILGSPFAGLHIRLQQLDSGNAKIKDHFAMGMNSYFGSSANLYGFPHRNSEGLVVTPEFTVDASCAKLRVLIRCFGAANSTPIRLALSDFFLVDA